MVANPSLVFGSKGGSSQKYPLRHGYKITELGAIPEDWSVSPVGQVFEIHNYLRLPISEGVREKMVGQFPYYGPTSVQGYINEYRIEGEYALIGEDGDHFLKWHDRPMTQLVHGRFNVNNHAHLVKGTRNSTSWFYHYFRNRDLTRYLTRQGAGRFKLKKATLVDIPCALPPTRAEQEAIVSALSDAEAFIDSLERQLAKKRDIKQGAMQELLTGKRRLPGFTGEWEVKRLGDVVDTDPENLGSNTRPTFIFNYIALEDVDVGILQSYSVQMFRTAPSRARRKLRTNDVLVSTVRPNLMSHLLFMASANSWVCSTGFCVVRCRVGVTYPGYIYSLLFAAGVARQIESLLTGSNYPAINSGDVKALRIPVPGYEEQVAIASILSDMDTEITALDAKLAKARNIKQGMMQALLTGRIRLV